MFARRDVSRREMLKLGLLGGASVLLPVGRLAESVLADSGGSPRTVPFQAVLPLPEVLTPVRRTDTTDYYDITMREAEAEILPGLKTPIWGFNGQYPGPTIKTRQGRRVVVKQINNLPEPMSIHLHGSYVDGDSDGHVVDRIQPGAFKVYEYLNDQQARTMWYHEHVLHLTATHVYKGLAGFYLLEDDLEAELNLPSGEFDIPLLIQDRLFNSDGSLNYPFPRHGTDNGVLGDTILVNGAVQPRLEVARRKYRFRFLNGANARLFTLALSSGQPFLQIGTEGGLLSRPVIRPTIFLPGAHRYDVVVDFSIYPVGARIVLRNRLGEGSTADIMRFDVVRDEQDHSSVPSVLRPFEPIPEHSATVKRTLRPGRNGGLWTIGGRIFDENRFDARPRVGDTEIWEVINQGGGWTHPLHIHLLNFQVLDRNGRKPPAGEDGWKETVQLGPKDTVRIIMKWPPVPVGTLPHGSFTNKYVFHCHNLEHEDHDMMGQIEVVG